MKIVADGNIPFVKECFSSIGEVEVVSGREMTANVVREADVLLVRSVTPVNKKLSAGSKVKFVGTATIGFEHIDVEHLKNNNIGFASASGSNANSVAEFIVGSLLEVGKKHKIKLEGKSIGIIGVGNVGSRVEKKCAALGMKIKLNDPPLQRQMKDKKYRPIEELFDCDIITLHTPLTFEGIDKTFHLADDKFFKSLKDGCVFINTSRGAVHETEALKDAISSKKLGAVILDVWEDEPNIDAELLEMVDIGTPHIAGYSLDGKVAGMIMIYKAVCEYFGIKAEYDMESFLPEAKVPQLKVAVKDIDEQEVLRQTVAAVYDIKKDDANLRWMLDRTMGKRGVFFDDLRKNYPVRREFQNTKVVVKGDSISEKLRGIGFEVSPG